MAEKMSGIKPPRKTLGQALKDIKDSADQDLKAMIEAAGKDLEVESAAAVLAYGVNAYPKQGINETPLPRNEADNRNYVPIDQGTSDLAMYARRAVTDVAADASNLNDFSLSTTHGDSIGSRRGTVLDQPDKNEQTTFTSQIPVYNSNAVNRFENTSKGQGAAASRLVDSAAGGFFTAEQLQDLLSKISAAGTFPTKSGHMLLASQHQFGASNPNDRPLDDADGPAGIKIPQVAARTHDQLETSNRYSPSIKSPYIKDPSSPDEKVFFSRGLYSVQVGPGKLGVYDKDGASVHTIDLRTMALQLMMRAQSDPLHAEQIDEAFAKGSASFLYDLAALVPGASQVGTARISKTLLRIKNTPAAKIRKLKDENGEDIEEPVGLDLAGGQDNFIQTTSGQAIAGVSPTGPTDGTGHPVIGPRGSSSYGTMNSFMEPFGGPTPMGMLFISVYSIIILSVLGLIIDGIAAGTGSDIGPKAVGEQPDPSGPEALQFGRWKTFGGSGLGDMFFELFGLPRLETNFFLAISKGIERFFDIPSLLDLLSGNVDFSAVMDAATGVALSPGYYATITKQVFRDFEQISEAAVDMAVNMSVLNTVVGIFKVIESLFSSFSFRFIVYLAVIGDIDIMSRQSPGTHSQGEFILPVDHKEVIVDPTPFTRMRVSRFNLSSIGVHTNPLSLTMFPSLILAPEFGKTSDALGQHMNEIEEAGAPGDGDIRTTALHLTMEDKINKYLTTIRPSQDDVKEIEAALELEYMPFYVHDLRTNEIISMPAFISDFSEDFAPEYNESHGYGRTDPIMTYSKTKRNINLTFRLVSFNDRDHEYMWFVINKFVSMCYPSRSAGLKRTFNEGAQHFIQPFSQVPTASPLIRLRLGEVLHSNYSKRNLARLFGLLGAPGVASIGLDNAALTPEKIKEQKKARMLSQYSGYVAEERKEVLKGIKNLETPSEKLIVKSGTLVYMSNHNTKTKTRTVGDLKFDVNEVVKQKWGKKKKYVVYVLRGTIDGKTLQSGGDNEKAFGPAALKKLYPETSIPPSAQDAKALLFGVTLKLSVCLTGRNLKKIHIDGAQDRAKKKRADEVDKAGVKAPDLAKEEAFLNSKTNPIIASFEATRGRGLAGFITALSFDYSQANWETEQVGSRAPQSVGITMSFSPVHDLPLGLDAEGHLIAPSHPVGSMMGTDPWDDSFGDSTSKEHNQKTDNTLQTNEWMQKLSWNLALMGAEVNKPIKSGGD